jgi:hypothetical protein
MVIKASSAAEVRALLEALGGTDDVHRDAAVARLAVIGPRAIDQLTRAYQSSVDRRARLGILRALEAIGDHRSAPLARLAITEGGEIAVAAVGVLRSLLSSEHASVSAEALDILIATALDPGKDRRLRLAALEALQDMPEDVRAGVADAIGRSDDETLPKIATIADADASRSEAVWSDAIDGRLPDDPRLLRDALPVRAAAAPLNTLRKLIDAVKEREASSLSLNDWRTLRGSLHHVLALRGSRVALYDLRESLEDAPDPLPVSFLAALHTLGDESCLEPLAAAWSRTNSGAATRGDATSDDDRWRHQLASAFAAIVRRERISRRHKILVRLKAQGSGLMEALEH